MYIQWFGTSDDLVLARSSMRDLGCFFSTNNLRFVKTFLEIIWESLIAKTWKSQNRSILANFKYIYYDYTCILNDFGTSDDLVLARGALRDLGCFSSKNNLRFVKSFLEIIWESLVAKKWKSQNRSISARFKHFNCDYMCIFNDFGLLMIWY